MLSALGHIGISHVFPGTTWLLSESRDAGISEAVKILSYFSLEGIEYLQRQVKCCVSVFFCNHENTFLNPEGQTPWAYLSIWNIRKSSITSDIDHVWTNPPLGTQLWLSSKYQDLGNPQQHSHSYQILAFYIGFGSWSQFWRFAGPPNNLFPAEKQDEWLFVSYSSFKLRSKQIVSFNCFKNLSTSIIYILFNLAITYTMFSQ